MRKILLSLMVTAFGAASAQAAIVTYDYSFTAQNFTEGFSHTTPPVDPVTGSFSVTFDDSHNFYGTSAGINSFNVNIGYQGTVLFNFLKTATYTYIDFSTGLSTTSYGGSITTGTPGFYFAFSIPNQTNSANVSETV